MWDGGRGNIVRALSKTDPCLEYITSLKSEELKGNWENCLKRERQLSPKTAFGKQFQAHIPNYLFLSFFGMWRTVQAPPAGKKCWCPLLFLTGIAVWLKRAMGESEHLEYFHFYITSSLIILFCTFSHSWFCSMLLRPPSPRLNTIQ